MDLQMTKEKISLMFVALFFYLGANAQTDLKKLQPDEYKQWHNLGMGEVSPKGNHLFYYLSSDYAPDTLVIAPLGKGTVRKITGGRQASFLAFQNRLLYEIEDRLVIENSTGDELKTYNSIKYRQILQGGKFMLLSPEPIYKAGEKEITIVSMEDFSEKVIAGVLTLSVDHIEKKIAYGIQNGGHMTIKVFELDDWKEHTARLPKSGVPTNMNWSTDDRSLVFLQMPQEPDKTKSTVCYIPEVSNLETINHFDLTEFLNLDDLEVSTYPNDFPRVSVDKKRILLMTKQLVETKDESAGVEVWRTNATWLYPYQNGWANVLGNKPKLTSFNITRKEIKRVTTTKESETIVASNGRYAINMDKSAYLPTYIYGNHYADIRVSDLQQNRDFLLEEKLPVWSSIMFTPDGNSILYRKDEAWQLFDLETNSVRNISQKIPHQLTKCANCYAGISVSNNKKFFFIFDQHDLWSVDVDNLTTKRLTNGKEKGIEFKFARSVYDHLKLNELLELDTEKGIFLQAWNRSTGETGYYKWSAKSGLEEIVYKDRKIESLYVLPQSKGYVYSQEDFNLSPEIVWKTAKNRQETIIGTSNPQQQFYKWGKSEMVHYKITPSSRMYDVDMNAALFYPADYQEGKKYPLIVSIYEDNSYLLHEYQRPGVDRFIDFNQTDYTLNGYFVICPKLTPRQSGNPGQSMIKNLQAAVDYMKGTGMIDSSRIGLYGHSFGGYEALFAATQMNDFATIVAGAGITDLVSDYFSHRELLSGPNFERTEQDQMGMKKTFYDIPELYLANSPLHHADRITAPILLWTGKNDTNVDWSQSVEFYLAMQRLGKTCTMLAYPEENHVLAKPENLLDLDTRLKAWFGHHLKGEEEKEWMKAD
jgi:dipeptidyl aminopeptidase/acylaminoacyl peptidase